MENFDLHLITGNLGTGKSTTGRILERELGAPLQEPDLMRIEMGIQEYDPADTSRVMAAIWDRILETLGEGNSITLATPYVKRHARQQAYDLICGIERTIGKSIETLLIRCECSETTSIARIEARGGFTQGSYDPNAYSRIKESDQPLQRKEFTGNPNVSFVKLNTQLRKMDELSVKAHHRPALERVRKILVPFPI